MCLIINFGLGGPDCFNGNLSELDRQLKGTSFREATELHTLAAILKVASDLIEDIPSHSLLSYAQCCHSYLEKLIGLLITPVKSNLVTLLIT